MQKQNPSPAPRPLKPKGLGWQRLRISLISFGVTFSLSLNLLAAVIWHHYQQSSGQVVAGQYYAYPGIALTPSNDIGTPDLSGTDQGRSLIAKARAQCALVLPAGDPTCQNLPITVQELPGDVMGLVVILEDPNHKLVYAKQMRLSPKILLSDPIAAKGAPGDTGMHEAMGMNYFIAHEWMHVRIAQIAKTPEAMKALNQQAALVFGSRTGQPKLDPARAGEMFNDCATWDIMGKPDTFTPAYLGNDKGIAPSLLCGDWRAMLLY